MNNKILTLFILIACCGVSYSAISPTSTIDFGGGLNLKTVDTQIGDNESPDMNNMVNDRYGSSLKRDGSERYISQAVSSNSVNSLYRVYSTSGTNILKALIMTTRDAIYYSTSDANPKWITISSGLASWNQHFSIDVMNNKVILTGDNQTDPPYQFNVNTSSFSPLLNNDFSSSTIVIKPKYIMNAKNYLLAANISQTDGSSGILNPGTTYYPSRIYYSLLLQPSSFTVQRFIDFRSDDGDQIMALGFMNKMVNVFKQNSIFELDYNALNLIVNGGDQIVRQVISGFGVVAPRTLATDGVFYYFLSKDGIRQWDGGGKTRLTVTDESDIISNKVQPIIDRIIRAGTYLSSVGFYYPKKRWYVFSYEDPERYPRGRNNSVLIYDIKNASWYKFSNWNIECLESLDGTGDFGQLMYGDSVDGYVHYCDLPQFPDDSRKEIVLETMDSTNTWLRGTTDYVNVIEGTGSVRMQMSAVQGVSSITWMSVINAGEWYDKSEISKSDKFSFKVYVSSIQNLVGLRMDLEMNNITTEFDSQFTSVTFSSSALSNGNTSWSTIEVQISSFPIMFNWVDLSTETLVFANDLTFYGIRFVSSATADCSISIDDLRIVQGSKNPLNSYRYTKEFNLGDPADKKWEQLALTLEDSADTSFSVDVISNFGQVVGRIDIVPDFEKSIYVGDYNGTNNVTKLSSLDYSVQNSTVAGSVYVFAARPLTVDKNFIYVGDQANNRILKIDKSTMTSNTFAGKTGSLGSGTSNFNVIYELAQDDKYLYVTDFGNHRIKVHNKDTLEFVKFYGSLGTSATSFHCPTGVAVDEKYVYVGDDGNSRIVKIEKSSGAFISQININLNNIGDTTLAVDEQYLYDEFNTLTNAVNFLDVVLEKRSKSDLSIVNKVFLKPMNNTTLISTFTRTGDITVTNDYIYCTFTDDVNGNGNFYIQKRKKSDLSLISEFKTKKRLFTACANGLPYKPKVKTLYKDLKNESQYIQLKYFDRDQLENSFKLINQSLIYQNEPITERY